MIVALLLLGLAFSVALSGFFSGSETGVYSLNRVRLWVAGERGEPRARLLSRLMESPEDLVVTMLLGTNIADYLATACVSALLLRVAVAPSAAELYATLIVTPLILVFGGVIPKNWFRRDADRLMYVLARPVALCRRVAAALGLLWLMRGLTRLLVRLIDAEQAAQTDVLPRARTLSLLEEGAARGGLSELQRDLIRRVIGISRIRVGSVMIPRLRTAMVPEDVRREDFLRVVRMAHFSRIPVYRKDPRRVIGIVNVYDVLTDSEPRPVKSYARPAFTLAPQTSVARALVEMQRAREAMAVVQDRRGQCLGILTLKDLVQEIIGEFEAW